MKLLITWDPLYPACRARLELAEPVRRIWGSLGDVRHSCSDVCRRKVGDCSGWAVLGETGIQERMVREYVSIYRDQLRQSYGRL